MPQDYRPSQFSSPGIPWSKAVEICGPVLALAFAAKNGRAPSMQEAVRLAEEGGHWRAGVGMLGPQEQVNLMRKMGIDAGFDAKPEWQKVADRAKRGEMIGVSTPQHYFLIQDFDPTTGRYFVGTSGTDMKGGSAWMTKEEIEQLGLGVQGIIEDRGRITEDRSTAPPERQEKPQEPGKPYERPIQTVDPFTDEEIGGAKKSLLEEYEKEQAQQAPRQAMGAFGALDDQLAQEQPVFRTPEPRKRVPLVPSIKLPALLR